MTKIDTICRRLRDVGIFLFGVAAVTLTVHYIYSQVYSPQRRIERAIQESFARDFEQSLVKQTEK